MNLTLMEKKIHQQIEEAKDKENIEKQKQFMNELGIEIYNDK